MIASTNNLFTDEELDLLDAVWDEIGDEEEAEKAAAEAKKAREQSKPKLPGKTN